MGLIMNNQQRRDEAKEWYRRAAEKDDRFATGEEARQGGRVLPFSRPNETG
jgi:TPR repeat protein